MGLFCQCLEIFFWQNDDKENEDFRDDCIDSIMDKVEEKIGFNFVIKISARNGAPENATPFWCSIISAHELE